MKESQILQSYEIARERYAALGVDTDKAVAELETQQISLHCWQTDDVVGFERNEALSGGIQTTGNYPGRARNIDEVRKDLEFVKTLLAGNHRVNLHEIYGDFGGKFVDRDEVGVEHFQSWIDWAKANNFKLDFNSTSFSHPKSGDLSLSNPDKSIREFWIEHTKRCRRIADAMGKAQGDPCIMNIWVHDGSKDLTVNRKYYRELLAAALDEILAEDLPGMKSCVEAKLFGIGLESYTVGSMDFFEGYCATRKVMYTLDTGHYEQTENVADKVAALLLYVPELMLHVSRPVRWDSDHVTIMNDQTQDLFKELVRADGLNRAHVGLDYFDASINRIGAYIIGTRATQKCILSALLEPLSKLREYEAAGQGFQRLALLEEAKTLPFGAVFDYFNHKNGVPVGEEFIPAIEQYEKEVTSKR
jgi:L-rhamnose isomerase